MMNDGEEEEVEKEKELVDAKQDLLNGLQCP